LAVADAWPAALLHVVCWVGGGGHIWIAYHLQGAHPSASAAAIAAILSGVIAIGLLVPGGVGVQELTYVGVGALFGMPAHVSLALSLVRQVRDILIGAPALVAWQAIKANNLRDRSFVRSRPWKSCCLWEMGNKKGSGRNYLSHLVRTLKALFLDGSQAGPTTHSRSIVSNTPPVLGMPICALHFLVAALLICF